MTIPNLAEFQIAQGQRFLSADGKRLLCVGRNAGVAAAPEAIRTVTYTRCRKPLKLSWYIREEGGYATDVGVRAWIARHCARDVTAEKHDAYAMLRPKG